VLTADSSVAIAALSSWHELHHRARASIADVRVLPDHALAETVSVLSRLPRGRAVPVRQAVLTTLTVFPEQPLTFDGAGHVATLRLLAGAGLGGRAIYDGLVAAVAHVAGARLLSADRRAIPTYEAVGVDYEIVE
jgi:predicted nucleic acid-binding protein